MRVRRLANQAKEKGRVNAEDIKIFEERQFYKKGLKRSTGVEIDGKRV
jgi:hypothetical protein